MKWLQWKAEPLDRMAPRLQVFPFNLCLESWTSPIESDFKVQRIN